ncbi:ubiquinone-binding protein [Vibrio sp. HA2012]|uniref:SRPBCC family protein n=1 Tax=Vibrio sp. HA2012 TaxID=1971595 RepID=UPI000C2B95B7|nr:SRPBCC family protein [Vibrio sp. HA2012]PJC86478.1 ubiquinone-binding protein [Vibrio sp. HA2012]
MPQIRRSALVSYSARQMYDLVNDVAHYPEFLPGCAGAEVLEFSGEKMLASVNVSKAGISKTFITANTLESGTSILMELVDGPFQHLRGGWYFTELDEYACKVELKLEFEFSSRLIELAFGKVFNELTNNMVTAFTRRAKQVY